MCTINNRCLHAIILFIHFSNDNRFVSWLIILPYPRFRFKGLTTNSKRQIPCAGSNSNPWESTVSPDLCVMYVFMCVYCVCVCAVCVCVPVCGVCVPVCACVVCVCACVWCVPVCGVCVCLCVVCVCACVCVPYSLKIWWQPTQY